MTLDYEHDEFVVVLADRGEFRQPAESSSPVPPLMDFKRVTVRVPERELRMLTAEDTELAIELFWFDDQRQRLAGRPVIYLDQNKWVQISRALNRPETIGSAVELDATLQLIEMARERRVVLPLSSGHYIETGPLYDQRRRDLAMLMVELSSGWIMRDPLTVRMRELVLAFQTQGAPGEITEPVFTLDPDALQTRFELPHAPDGTTMESANEVLAGASARFAVLLENEAVTNPEGDAYTTRWAEAQQRAADLLRSDASVRASARVFTLHAFLSDLGLHLEEACRVAQVDLEVFRTWLTSAADDQIKSLRYLGRAREVHHQRLMNAEDRWHPHDLIDWLFLALAAGYADHLVCENSHGHQLRRAAAAVPTRGATISTSFRELLTNLGGLHP